MVGVLQVPKIWQLKLKLRSNFGYEIPSQTQALFFQKKFWGWKMSDLWPGLTFANQSMSDVFDWLIDLVSFVYWVKLQSNGYMWLKKGKIFNPIPKYRVTFQDIEPRSRYFLMSLGSQNLTLTGGELIRSWLILNCPTLLTLNYKSFYKNLRLEASALILFPIRLNCVTSL